MSLSILVLLAANAVYLSAGAGIAALSGMVDARVSTWPRLAGAYLLGAAALGGLQTYLAFAGVTLGWLELTAIALALLAGGVIVASREVDTALARPAAVPRSSLWGRIPAYLLLAGAVAMLAYAGRTIGVRPLVEWDGAFFWAVKAGLLSEFSGTTLVELLRDPDYGAPSYPLLLPALQAAGLRAMGTFDASLIDLQLLLLAFGFVGAVWAFLREHCTAPVVAAAILMVVSAPQFLFQLSTNYADVPLAIFVAAGIAAWLPPLAAEESPESWRLLAGSFLLGAAALTKNEGLLFALAAALALVVASLRAGWRMPALAAAGGVVVLALPWRIFTAVAGMRPEDYELANVFDVAFLRERSGRVAPVVDELSRQLWDTGEGWGYPVLVAAIALAAAIVARRTVVAAFVAVWFAASFAGLILVYWISVLPLENGLSNTSNRTVVTLLVVAGTVAPVLLDGAIRAAVALSQGAIRAGSTLRTRFAARQSA